MTAPPASLTTALAGRYEIERELGAGGMATVYLAHDVRHQRMVALKVIKPEVVATVGANRFVTEIRTTAHLKHPHILPLFDSGTAGEAPFYVMPYIEGESLGGRLRRDGPLPVAEAVHILRELVDALAYAHAQGIVHRDIKPDNVLLSERHVFLADFGIARALEAGQPTDSTMTAAAAIVGTPAYMSPEQAAGSGRIDHRSDIYALGAMAYEMLAGAPPFTGDTAPVIMAAHLTAIPEPLSTRLPTVPSALAALVMKCLEKRPEDRWTRTDDLLAELDAVSASLRAGVETRSPTRAKTVTLAAAILLTIALAVAAGWLLLERRSSDPGIGIGGMTHVTREQGLEIDPALSPDGRTVAYVSGPPGKRRLYIRQLDGGRAIALTEAGVAEAQRRPDWSPDGSRIVFQAGYQGFGVRQTVRTTTLYIVPALGGTPALLLPQVADRIALTPAWSPDGSQIAYCTLDGIYVTPSLPGGDPKRVLVADRSLHSVRWSPDGSQLAFVAGGADFALGEDQLGNVENSAIHVLTIATGADQKITTGEWLDLSPVWTPDGRGLLFVSTRGGGRDVYRVRLSPAGAPAASPERISSGLNALSISLSRDGGRLAYSSYTSRANIWSTPIPQDRVATVADAEPVTSGSEKTEKLVVSRDGQWLAYDSDRNGNTDVWKVRIAGGEPEQVTRDPANEFVNDWSPDGQEILYHTIRPATRRDLMIVSADGTRTEIVAATHVEEQQGSWSPDGNSIVFTSGPTPGAQFDVFVVSRVRKGDPWGAPRRLTKDRGADPRWSPDGKSVAYSRQGEIRIISPDGASERVLVRADSLDGVSRAQFAVWSPDGQTVYAKAHDDDRRASIWSVPAAGGTPRLLVRFDDPARPSLRREFATDGQRFYFTIAQDESDVWVMELIGR